MRLVHSFSTLALVSLGLALTACSASTGTGSDDGAGASSQGGEAAGGQGTGASTSDSTTGSTGSGFGQGGGTVGCDPACDPGFVCDGGQCVPGCSDASPCAGDLACCNGACIDVQSDAANCGNCGQACPDFANAPESCEAGQCVLGACDSGTSNCDGSSMNGCEVLGDCTCAPGSTQSCYEGPMGTENIGACTSGTQTCDASGASWGFCLNQIFPIDEICGNGIDDDCDGQVDEDTDADGDGYGVCSGDCCDVPGLNCGSPALVNPGAVEAAGNMVDDDCNPATPDTGITQMCSSAAKFTGVTPIDVLNAMDLCQLSQNGSWGIVNAEFRLSNGTVPTPTQLTTIQDNQVAIMTQYGTNASNLPKKGMTFAGISSGRMRDANDPGYVSTSSNNLITSAPPAAYLAAHNNALPSSAGCSGTCPAGSGANDPVNVRAQIKVPTNAKSMSYKFRFFSSEYWSWSCTIFNDFYLALLTSGAPGIPADKNISFDALNNPVSVNNGFFDVCIPKGCYTCPLGSGALAGTGMETTGGATNWLTTTAPVLPGETITLEFMVFDVSDGILDTNVLLDQFEFSIMPSMVGTKE